MKKFLFILTLLLFYIGIFSQNNDQDSQYQQIKNEIENIKKEIPVQITPENINQAVQKYLKIGHLYTQRNDVDNAQIAFEKVISLDNTNDKAYFMLGLIYEKKKMYSQAIDAWQKCILYTKKAEIKEIAQKHLNYLKK